MTSAQMCHREALCADHSALAGPHIAVVACVLAFFSVSFCFFLFFFFVFFFLSVSAHLRRSPSALHLPRKICLSLWRPSARRPPNTGVTCRVKQHFLDSCVLAGHRSPALLIRMPTRAPSPGHDSTVGLHTSGAGSLARHSTAAAKLLAEFEDVFVT